MKFSCKTFFLLFILAVSGQASAIENPLKLQVRFNLPEGINSVHQAAQYFIEAHGYQIQYALSAPTEAIMIARAKLPNYLPSGKLLTIEKALLELLQDDQLLIVDTTNKLISFGSVEQ